jgi:hypothetical protein
VTPSILPLISPELDVMLMLVLFDSIATPTVPVDVIEPVLERLITPLPAERTAIPVAPVASIVPPELVTFTVPLPAEVIPKASPDCAGTRASYKQGHCRNDYAKTLEVNFFRMLIAQRRE